MYVGTVEQHVHSTLALSAQGRFKAAAAESAQAEPVDRTQQVSAVRCGATGLLVKFQDVATQGVSRTPMTTMFGRSAPFPSAWAVTVDVASAHDIAATAPARR
jgi:hypothetical protein